jgi:hypothetical protein
MSNEMMTNKSHKFNRNWQGQWLLAAARGCVKTPRRPDTPEKWRSHFRYGAFLFSVKVIRTAFSFFKMTESEFSHSLAIC